jgi:RecT family
MTTTTTTTEQDKSLATGKPKALAVMANRLNVDPQKLLQTLKDTVFKGANESELLTLVVVANEYGLSPLLKEIYAFPAKGGGITPVVSIDGWISMVNRQSQFDGLEFSFESDGEGAPIACTCTIYVKGRTHPVRVTEFFKECFRNTEPWKQMPRRMLRHKALKEAARVAFGFSGVSDEDEAHDVANRQFPPPRRVNAEKPDFSEPKKADATEVPANSGAQPDAKQPGPEPSKPATAPKPEKKAKTAAKEEKPADGPRETKETPQDRLFAALSEHQIEEPDFIAGLKLIKSKGVPDDVELVHELADDLCEKILSVGLSQTMEEIRDARWLEEQK